MAIGLSSLEKSAFLRCLLIGPPKLGKTTAAVTTVPRPVRVLLCEDDSALQFVKMTAEDEGIEGNIDDHFSFERIVGQKSMLEAIVAARDDAQKGIIRSIVIDPISFYGDTLLDQCYRDTRSSDGNDDGRRAHPELTKRLRHQLTQLFRAPAHVVIVSHYLDVSGAAKIGGEGRVPMLPNKESRALVGAMVHQAVWMDVIDGKRVFVTAPKGAWGPGCRGLKGHEIIAADFAVLIDNLGMTAKAIETGTARAVDGKATNDNATAKVQSA